MALELLGGSVFALLYDGVKHAIGKTGTFKYLLRDIKSTLESLNKLHATAIRQIGEYNLELGLPNDEVEDLKQQMAEGAKLVGKLSDFRVWNYCCLNCYTDQLVDLDRSLKRLLDNIKLQETRDVKEILDLLRKYRVELDELKGMLHMLLQQRAGDVTETSNSTAATSTETMPQQSEGNGEHEQGASLGGADLGAVYRVLFDVVTEVKDKTMMFRPLLGDLKSNLDSLKPLIEEIAQHNNVLVLPNEELEKFRIQMDKGVELVRKCSKVRAWASYKKYNYTIRLIGLNESIQLQLSRLREQVAREVSETLASISNLKEAVKQIEGPPVIQNQLEITGSCEVPEPSSPTMMRESEDSVEVHPLPLPLGANLHSSKVLITTEPEFQPMKGQWQTLKLIGRGTLGNVYVAFNRETGALCAMKEVDFIPDDPKSAECIKQLQQEISVLSQLKHPNIVQYYGSEIVEDRFFIYQEYVHHGFRNGYIQEHCGAMTEAIVRSFTLHILSGLAYLHSTKTIHWDIKWANLLVDSSGVVKLADFGMAKILSGHSYNLSLKGSPHWMAPELINETLILNDKSSDHDLALAVDIWSLGCTIIEMLTGKPPWSELEGPQAMFNTLHKDPPIPKTLSPEGKDFLRRCLQRNPAMRSTAVMLLEHPFLKNSQPQDVPTTTHVKQKEEGSMTGIEKSFMHVLGEQVERGTVLDKSFGFSKHLSKQYELGKEVGRGNFSYTCIATFKKGKLKGQHAAVKVISKAKMTTAIAINDVRREVKILKALTGHNNIVKFYDAYEDHDNVYIVMEYCAGGELLDRILARGGKYPEDDARTVMIQILNAVAFCHLQCVVHRDLKPENFLFTSSDEDSQMKAIDFGLSDFVKPDQRLNDIVGTTYQVAPEVLHRSYSTQADMWSVGVIAYVLLSGTRPFWARTESGIFRAVLKANPSFDEPPWPSLSTEAKDFVKRLLNKDYRKRMTAAQALSHLWLKNYNNVKVPLDILIFKLMKAYMLSSPLRKAALGSLSKTLTPDDLCYMAEQFEQLEPDDSGTIGLENIRTALMKNATDAMKEERYADILASLNALQYRRMEFQEFCAATLCVYQLEALGQWEQQSRYAYELFDKDGNKVVVIEELASDLGLNSSVPVHTVLEDWIRKTDGKLSFVGFVKLLHGVSSRTFARAE